MQTYRVLIVDDDAAQRAAIRHMIEGHPSSQQLDVEEVAGVAELRQRKADCLGDRARLADVVFMDIDLGEDEATGIEAAGEMFPADSGTQVIYVTGYIEYCTRVYRTEHIYFLVKPLVQQDFDDAMNKALANLAARLEEPLGITLSGTTRFVAPADIEYLESRGRKVHVVLSDKTLETYSSLSHFEEQLPSYFVRCHKSYLVNLDKVEELQPEGLRMQSGRFVSTSQSRRKAVRKAFLLRLSERL